jgi:hypothetical protein
MHGMRSFATRTCARATFLLLALCAPLSSRLARGAEGNLSNLSNGCARQCAHPHQCIHRGCQRTQRTRVGMARHQPYCPLPRMKATAKSGSNPPPTSLNLLPTRTPRGTCARARPTHTHTNTRTHTHVVHTHTHTHTHTQTHAHTHTSYIHIRTHIHTTQTHFHTCMCVFVCVCTHTHIHAYIPIHIAHLRLAPGCNVAGRATFTRALIIFFGDKLGLAGKAQLRTRSA